MVISNNFPAISFLFNYILVHVLFYFPANHLLRLKSHLLWNQPHQNPSSIRNCQGSPFSSSLLTTDTITSCLSHWKSSKMFLLSFLVFFKILEEEGSTFEWGRKPLRSQDATIQHQQRLRKGRRLRSAHYKSLQDHDTFCFNIRLMKSGLWYLPQEKDSLRVDRPIMCPMHQVQNSMPFYTNQRQEKTKKTTRVSLTQWQETLKSKSVQ
jgi:hypothetical protein